MDRAKALIKAFCKKHNLPVPDINSGDQMEIFFCFNPLLSRKEAQEIIDAMTEGAEQ